MTPPAIDFHCLCEKKQNLMRWGFLFLASILLSISFYVWESLSPIKETLQIRLGFSSTEYGLLISVYSIPNTILLMAILGGVLSDRLGIRKTGLLFTLFCTFGALLTAYGASDSFSNGGLLYGIANSFLTRLSPELKMMIAGRFLFGLGAETLNIVVLKILVKWFKGKKMAFAFAVMTIVARMGTALVLIVSPILIEAETGWTTSLWFAALIMIVGLGLFCIYMFFDRKYSHETADSENEEKFDIKDITSLLKNRAFLLICLLCVAFYSAFFPFLSFLPDFLHNKFDLSLRMSGMLSSIVIWGTILFIPFIGWFVDKKGKITTLLLCGAALLSATHLLLSLSRITPLIGMVLLGISFTLVPAALWPAVPRIVEEKKIGTAYGIMTWIQSLGLLLFPFFAGRITDIANRKVTAEVLESGVKNLDYTYTVLMFAVLGASGFLFAYFLKIEDKKRLDRVLEFPEKIN
ncbi:MAG: MFS transporter [Candidatus Aminicenantes bacterium]|nr:MFS transporter [Candidatus Aminicenantes bacterium]